MKHVTKHLLLLGLVLFGFRMGLGAENVGPGMPAGRVLPPESLLEPNGTLAVDKGLSGTIDLRGWSATVDSKRGPVLSPEPYPPMAEPTWYPLPDKGLDHVVTALALTADGELYVGGYFTATADWSVTGLYHIAKYSNGTWSSLANAGLNGTVYALAVSNSGELYVGGTFSATADGSVTQLNNIAKYSGGAWSPLANNGLNSDVYALAVNDAGDLYVGGRFSATADGSSALNCIASYSSGAWSQLAHAGLDREVWSLKIDGPDLYVGGVFTQTADGSVTDLSCIARYTGGTWYSLANGGLWGAVCGFAVSHTGDLYVAGGFTTTWDGSVTLNYVARYSNGAWSPLADAGLNTIARGIVIHNTGDVYVCGEFTRSADGSVTDLNYVARYSGGSWYPLPNNGLDYAPYSLAATANGDLYFGGLFSATADGRTDLRNIARLSSAPHGPTINSIRSKTCKGGKPATIDGSGFSPITSINKVYFDRLLAVVRYATDARLGINIPSKCKSGRTYKVRVVVGGVASNIFNFKVK